MRSVKTEELFPPTDASRKLCETLILMIEAFNDNEGCTEGEIINTLVFLKLIESINGDFDIEHVVQHLYYMAYKISQIKDSEEAETKNPYVVKFKGEA